MTDPRPITRRLKEDTRDLHTRAEKGALQQALLRGTLPREAYVAMLQQLRIAHDALETRLRDAADRVPAIARVVRPEQYQTGYIDEDLAHFGAGAAGVEANPGTRAFLDLVERAAREPIRLLAIHYVLEGSNNGNRFIALAIAKALGLEPGEAGTRYLDPYGTAQREKWTQFKSDLEACGLSEAEMSAMVEAAKDAFRTITAMYEDLEGMLEPESVA